MTQEALGAAGSVPVLAERGGVHVWRASLRQCRPLLASAMHILAPDEISSVQATTEPRRSRKLVARACLRTVLGGYLDMSPAAVTLAVGRYGKPALAPSSSGIEFNLSTTGDLCLIAVTRTGPVGIDVEAEAPVPEAMQLAQRFFTAAETEALASGDRDDVRRFLRYWTAKEAYVKAVGTGLTVSLGHLVVPPELEHDATATALDTSGRRWLLVNVDPARGAIATLAVEPADDGVTVMHLSLDGTGVGRLAQPFSPGIG